MIQLKGLECDLLKVPNPESLCDGYLWTGPVNRQTINIQPGVVLELTQFFGGVTDEGEEYKVCRHEYRLLAPTNRLFFVHYLAFDGEGKCRPRPVDSMSSAVPPFPQMPSIRPPMPPVHHQMPNIRPPMPQASKSQPMPAVQLPKKPLATAQAGAHEDSPTSIDENEGVPNQRVDLAFNRLRFQKQLLARLFCPSFPVDGGESLSAETLAVKKTELPSLIALIDSQIEVLRTEVGGLDKVKDWLEQNNREKRIEMNKLFAQIESVGDEAGLESLLAEWK